MGPADMVALYEYNAWADRRVLEAASALTREQFTKQMGSSFSSVRDTLAHIYGVEWLWLERFQGRLPSAIPDDSEFADIAKLKASSSGEGTMRASIALRSIRSIVQRFMASPWLLPRGWTTPHRLQS